MFNKKKHFNQKTRQKITIITTITLVILLAISVFFCILSNNKVKNKVDSFMNTKHQTLDNKIEEDLLNYLQVNLENYSRPSEYSLFFENIINSDLKFLTQLRVSLIDNLRFQDDFSDIILYRTYDGIIVSSKKNPTRVDDISLFFNIGNLTTDNTFDSPGFLFTGENTITSANKVAYLYPIYRQKEWPKKEIYTGFTSLIIDDPSLFFRTDVKEFNSEGTFVVVTKNNILHTEGADTLSETIIFDMVSNEDSKGPSNRNVQNVNYTYSLKPASTDGLYYLYYEPSPNMFINLLTSKDYASNYVLSILILLIIYAFIVHELINSKNEQERQNVAIQNYKDQVSLHNRSKGEILKDKLASVKGKHSYYFAAIFEADPSYVSKLSINQSLLYRQTLIEEIKNTLDKLELPHSIGIDPDGYLVCIINHDKPKKIDSLMHLFLENFKEFSKSGFNIYHTHSYNNKDQAIESYPPLIDFTKYAYIYDFPNVFSLKKLEAFEDNDEALDTCVIKTIQSYLTELNPDNFKEYLYNTLESVKTNGYSYDQTFDFFQTVLAILKSLLLDKSVDNELIHLPLTKIMKRFNNIEECIEFLIESFEAYKEETQKNQTPTNLRHLNKTLKYINDNIETVTLYSVADEFNISSAHLSRVFKENMDINFSDYVTEKKLLKATELLKENPSITVTDLSKKLGYNTPSYFSTKFKERFGVTPSVYKKSL